MSGAAPYPPAVWHALARHAESDPAREVCGFLVRRGSGDLEVVPIPNAAEAGEARRAFAMEPAAQLRVLRRLSLEGGEVVAVYHSHLDAPAVPSEEDLAAVLCDGDPVWPGVEHVVVAVRGGRAGDIRRYRLAGAAFQQVD